MDNLKTNNTVEHLNDDSFVNTENAVDVQPENTNNTEEHLNDDSFVNTEKAVDMQSEEEKSNIPINNNEVYKETLTAIYDIKEIYTSDNTELLEVINQRNVLLDEIIVLNERLANIQENVLKSNILYDEFKKGFAQSVAEDSWGEKIFYALPIFDEYDANDPWIVLWCDVMQEAVKDKNKKNIRNFINKNLYNSTFSLPKDVYYYKINPKEIKDVEKDVTKLANVFSTKTWIFFKFIKDFSDHLRLNLLKSQLLAPLTKRDLDKVIFPSQQEIQEDVDIVLTNGDSEMEIYKKYRNYSKITEIIQSSSAYIASARELYQQVLSFRTELCSFEKQVYTKSLMDVYRLYDSVKKCMADFENAQSLLSDSDEPSSICCAKFIYRIQKMISKIEDYLFQAYSIKPIDIKVGENFNNYDVMWYEVLTAEDAPNENLIECVSSISDTGFAKYNINGVVEKVTRAARISVYRSTVEKGNN